MTFISRIISLPVIFYRRYISVWKKPCCKFYPTCSTYALDALRTHGACKGMLLTINRLRKCHPWSLGGVDYVPERGSWKSPRYYMMSTQELNDYWKQLDSVDENSAVYDHYVRTQLSMNKDKACEYGALSGRNI